MINAKEASKLTEENKLNVNEKANSLINSLEPKIKEAAVKGRNGLETLTFPWTQVSRETLTVVETKLKALGYKVVWTESFAHQNFTLTLSWE